MFDSKKIKNQRNSINNKTPAITEGEVWWVAVGENIGIEINGKSKLFSRPVLVFKKLSNMGFLGIPLTSQKHTGNWYTEIKFKGNSEFVALAQVRVFSTKRLYDRIGQIDESDMDKITKNFKKLYLTE